MDFGKLRRELAAGDEEALLKLQEDFNAGDRHPAAKVTRIFRPKAGPQVPTAAAINELQSSCSAQAEVLKPLEQPDQQRSQLEEQVIDDQADQPRPAGVLAPAIPGILGDIVERDLREAGAPAPPRPALGRAFPEASHRRLSKFALGRRKAAAAGAGGPEGAEAAPGAPSQGSGRPESTQPVTQRSAKTSVSGGSGGAGPSPQTDEELRRIEEQNVRQVEAMSDPERREALQEVAERFGADKLEFLRRRAASRQQQQQKQQQRNDQPTAGAVDAQLGQPRTLPLSQQQQQQQPAPSHGTAGAVPAAPVAKSALRRGFLGGPRTPCAAKQQQMQRQLQQHQHQHQDQQRASKQQTAPAGLAPAKPTRSQGAPEGSGTASGRANGGIQAQQRPLVARLRFGLTGDVVGVDSSDRPLESEESVLQRDQLSRDRGLSPEGYTLDEVRALARSSHAPQRAAALRMLEALLMAAQPGAQHVGRGGAVAPRPVPLPKEVKESERQAAAAAAAAHQAAAAPSVDWSQVFEYLVVVVRAALLLRLALDDGSASVFSAAAAALRALVAPRAGEAAVFEAADMSSAVSWPLAWRGALRRLGAGGAWEAAGELLEQSKAARAAGQEEDEQADAPEDLAAIDPLAGFMAMDPLPRMLWLLRNRAATEAAAPLLEVLCAAAASGRRAAEEVAACPGMAEALASVLGPEYCSVPSVAHGAASGDGSIEPDSSAAAAAHPDGASGATAAQLRPAALRLLRLLAQASPGVARWLLSSGLLAALQAALMRRPAAAGGAAFESDALIRLEAMRIWRVAAAQGVPLMNMDLMFLSVCTLLELPPPEQQHPWDDAPSPPSLPAAAALAPALAPAVQWQLRCEALQLFEALVAHAVRSASGQQLELGPEMVGPECVAAVASSVADAWASEAAIGAISRLLVSKADARLPHRLSGGAGIAAGCVQHPAQLLPAAHAALSALAAAWHLVATCTAGPGPGQRQVAEAVWRRLSAAGATSVPTPGNSPSGGPSQAAPAAGAAPPPGSVSTADALALSLLSEASEGPASTGAALSNHLVALACAAPAGPGSCSAGGGSSSDSDESVAAYCMSAAAASALAALCRLEAGAAAACRGSTAGVPVSSSSSSSSSICVAKRCSLAAAGALASRAAGISASPLALDAWHHAWMQTAQPVERLLLQAASQLPPSPPLQQALQAGLAASRRGQETSEELVLFDGLLSLLVLTPPGLEAQCLKALQLAFGSGNRSGSSSRCGAALSAVCSAALSELCFLHAGQGGQAATALANAAAGRRTGGGSASAPARPPYPLPGCLDASLLAAVLQEGYAASWLSTVPSSRLRPQGQRPLPAGAAGPGSAPLPALVAATGDDPKGSRLPAPPVWALTEALAVPGGPADPRATAPVSSGAAAGTMHPASAALMLSLGCGELGLRCTGAAAAPPVRLSAALQQCYLGDAWELMPPAAEGQQQQEREPSWRDAGARWAMAALTLRWCGDLVGFEGGSSSAGAGCGRGRGDDCTGEGSSRWEGWLSLPAAERMVRQSAEVSMGDPLWGAHLALLLLPSSGASLRRVAWSALSALSSLHLLPPPAGCVGGARPYVAGPFDSGFVAEAAKSLANGDLEKAMQLGSISADVALHAVASFALDPSTWAREQAKEDNGRRRGGGPGPAGAVDAAGRATNVLRGVVRGAPAEVVRELARAARARGVAREDVQRTMALCCHGDAQLMERVAQAMSGI